MKTQITTRDATLNDIDELAVLISDLGYPTTGAEMLARFLSIDADPGYKTVVAVLDNEVVGMAGITKGLYYEHNGGYLRLLALVVKQPFRKRGVGKQLLAFCESYAIENGLSTIVLNSGNREERKSAFAFYQKNGFTVQSSGFVKTLKAFPTG